VWNSQTVLNATCRQFQRTGSLPPYAHRHG
jgi:hypothetical protein